MSTCGHSQDWHNCYAGSHDLWVPEAYSHPAKGSPALFNRILTHLEEMGLLRLGDVVCDMMSGVGTTLLVAGLRGYRSVGVELESRFHSLTLDNIDYVMRYFCQCNETRQEVPNLREVIPSVAIGEQDVLLSEMPPALEQGEALVRGSESKVTGEGTRQPGNGEEWPLEGRQVCDGGLCIHPDSISHGEAGTCLVDGTTDGSPPLPKRSGSPQEREPTGQSVGELRGDDDRGTSTVPQPGRQEPSAQSKTCPNCSKPTYPGITIIQGDARHLSDLLRDRGMIGITSPPYQEANDSRPFGGLSEVTPERTHRSPDNISKFGQTTTTPGQIGRLKDGPDRVVGVTSPPYEKSMDSNEDAEARATRTGGFKQGQQSLRYADNPLTYLSRDPSGLSNKQRHEIATQKLQIGQHEGESYLSAMRQVYQQAYLCCDVLVTVTKNPTRAGKLRDLSGDTRRLLEEVGFTIRCHHHAILFKELEQGVLIGEAEGWEHDWPNAVEATPSNWPGVGWEHVYTPSEEDYEELNGEPWPVDESTKPNTAYWLRRMPSGTVKISGNIVKGRLSFFKRLSYQKGSPVAQWEDVIVAVRDGGGLKGITSPPYEGNVSESDSDPHPERQEGKPAGRHYGQTPGQIGNLK